MKSIITILLVLFTATLFAQGNIRGKKFELTGKIINQVSLAPPCGVFAWATVMEFKIIRFSNLNYKPDTIAVIFTCPDFYKDDFFQVGSTYVMTVADENQADFGWGFFNDSILKKYKLEKDLWVLTAEKLY